MLLPARDVALFYLPYASASYSFVYWWGDAAAILLSLGVIVETIWHLIEPYAFLRTALRSFGCLASCVAVAAVAILHWSQGRSGDQIIESILLFERSARFLQVCLLIVVIGLISRLGIDLAELSVGITAGFGHLCRTGLDTSGTSRKFTSHIRLYFCIVEVGGI